MKMLRAGNKAFPQDHAAVGKCVRRAFAAQRALAGHGEDYHAYQRGARALLPWIPQKEAS
jgi:hypothetical protein